jgi:hypothetical protein
LTLFSTEDGVKKGQIELLHYRIESNKEKEILINGRKCTVEGLIKAAYVDDGIAPLQKVFSCFLPILAAIFPEFSVYFAQFQCIY